MRALTAVLMVALAASLVGCASAPTGDAGPDATAAPAVPVVSRPTRIRIPALKVDVAIIDLGLQPDGTMQVPPDAKDAGWYAASPSPGEVGPSVVVGHRNWKGVNGPFARLEELKNGDRVDIEHDNGAVTSFIVDRNEQYLKSAFPGEIVYGDTPDPQLRLVTCSGELDRAAHSYKSNTIVTARLAA